MTKILLVEDDKSLREIYGVRLLAEGYDIVTAGDGEEALAMAIKERPQLIVSDVMMPKISGFDMLDILRSTSETKDIKVIMMTALSSEDQRARGEALGADRYLVKSQVGIEDVVRTVHEVLGDAPVSGGGTPQPPAQPAQPQESVNTPAQSGGRPAPSVTPGQRPDTPAPARVPQPTTPATPPPQPAEPPTQPAPEPQQQSQPAQAAGGLPQPTAPFSTNRPAGLGDRIIHPISQPGQSNQDIASRMQEELDQHQAAPASPQPAEPPMPTQPSEAQQTPMSTPSQPPAPESSTRHPEPSAPQAQTPEQQPEAPQQAPQPTETQEEAPQSQPEQPSSRPEDHGIEFEETPRTPTPPQPPMPPAPGTPSGP